MVKTSVLEERIRGSVSGVQHLVIKDLTGTEDHYEATVVASAFEGKTRIEQHQMIYRALGELMKGPVHALSLQTFTPQAWQSK